MNKVFWNFTISLENVLEDFIFPLNERKAEHMSLLRVGWLLGVGLPRSSSLLGSCEAGSGLAPGQCDNQGLRSLFFQSLFLRFFIDWWKDRRRREEERGTKQGCVTSSRMPCGCPACPCRTLKLIQGVWAALDRCL